MYDRDPHGYGKVATLVLAVVAALGFVVGLVVGRLTS